MLLQSQDTRSDHSNNKKDTINSKHMMDAKSEHRGDLPSKSSIDNSSKNRVKNKRSASKSIKTSLVSSASSEDHEINMKPEVGKKPILANGNSKNDLAYDNGDQAKKNIDTDKPKKPSNVTCDFQLQLLNTLSISLKYQVDQLVTQVNKQASDLTNNLEVLQSNITSQIDIVSVDDSATEPQDQSIEKANTDSTPLATETCDPQGAPLGSNTLPKSPSANITADHISSNPVPTTPASDSSKIAILEQKQQALQAIIFELGQKVFSVENLFKESFDEIKLKLSDSDKILSYTSALDPSLFLSSRSPKPIKNGSAGFDSVTSLTVPHDGSNPLSGNEKPSLSNDKNSVNTSTQAAQKPKKSANGFPKVIIASTDSLDLTKNALQPSAPFKQMKNQSLNLKENESSKKNGSKPNNSDSQNKNNQRNNQGKPDVQKRTSVNSSIKESNNNESNDQESNRNGGSKPWWTEELTYLRQEVTWARGLVRIFGDEGSISRAKNAINKYHRVMKTQRVQYGLEQEKEKEMEVEREKEREGAEKNKEIEIKLMEDSPDSSRQQKFNGVQFHFKAPVQNQNGKYPNQYLGQFQNQQHQNRHNYGNNCNNKLGFDGNKQHWNKGQFIYPKIQKVQKHSPVLPDNENKDALPAVNLSIDLNSTLPVSGNSYPAATNPNGVSSSFDSFANVGFGPFTSMQHIQQINARISQIGNLTQLDESQPDPAFRPQFSYVRHVNQYYPENTIMNGSNGLYQQYPQPRPYFKPNFIMNNGSNANISNSNGYHNGKNQFKHNQHQQGENSKSKPTSPNIPFEKLEKDEDQPITYDNNNQQNTFDKTKTFKPKQQHNKYPMTGGGGGFIHFNGGRNNGSGKPYNTHSTHNGTFNTQYSHNNHNANNNTQYPQGNKRSYRPQNWQPKPFNDDPKVQT